MNNIRKLAIEMTIGDWFSSWSGDEVDVYNYLNAYDRSDELFDEYIETVEALEDLVLWEGKEYMGCSKMKYFMKELDADISNAETYLMRAMELERTYDKEVTKNDDGLLTSVTIKIGSDRIREVAQSMLQSDNVNGFISQNDRLLSSLGDMEISNILNTLSNEYDTDFGIDANTIRHAICDELGLDPVLYNC
jgi:cell fate (sporulation/competence/biofilm development) regulator YlbF (YheA/YmcA/DUF963 family)